MDKKLVAWVKSSLRRTWGRSRMRRDALLGAKVEYGKYRCAGCGKVKRRKEIQVDHVEAVGRFVGFDEYIEKLFCEVGGLQILCKSCHKAKTKKDLSKMTKKTRKKING